MSREIDREICALEKRLGMGMDVEPACGIMSDDMMEVPPSADDDLNSEIMALEDEIAGCCRNAAHKSQSEVVEDADQELADLYNEINSEDEATISKGAEGETGFFPGSECQNVQCRKPTPEAATMPKKASEGDKINNPEEPHGKGGLWQDKDVVEMEMGVDDLGEDTLDAVKDSTEFTDGEFIYAKRLHEASARLDRVAASIEARGGNWKKLAYRLDKIADAIDSEKHVTLKKVAAARKAARS